MWGYNSASKRIRLKIPFDDFLLSVSILDLTCFRSPTTLADNHEPVIMSAMRKIPIVCLVAVLMVTSVSYGFDSPKLESKPSKINVNVSAYLAVGSLKFPAWDNEHMPQLRRMPRIKVGTVPIITGTQIWGTSLSRLLTNEGFTNYMARNYPNLKTIEFNESYKQFSQGELVSNNVYYNAVTNNGMMKETAKDLMVDATKEGVDWTIPGLEANYESVSVRPGFENLVDLADVFGSELMRANGQALESVSQGYFPPEGFAEKPVDFSICHPYTSIPVVYAEDQYLDYYFRPLGTITEIEGGQVVTKPGTEHACAIRFKHLDTYADNIPINPGIKGIDDIDINLTVRYTGEYRFDYAVDPPQIAGQANLPEIVSGNGVASMYDTENNQYLVQSLPSLRKLYRWIPHTNPGYSWQRLNIAPAVRKKCFVDSKLWEFSHFRVCYPQVSLEGDHLIVTEEAVDISGVSFDELTMGEIAYFRLTNLPWLDGATSTQYIETVDRPMRVVAVYEPGVLSPRGKDTICESTRLHLHWGVTNEMGKLAEIKRKEWGADWWKNGFPTYYNINVTADDSRKTIEKISPTQSDIIVDGLKPGIEYTWELETWVSDDNGSPSLMDTWTSEPVNTVPLPNLVGHCAQADAITLETEIDNEGDEVWKIVTPYKYRLGSAELQPLNFEARPGARMEPVGLNQLDMVDVNSEDVGGRTSLVARIKVTQFEDKFVKDDEGSNIIHVHFMPQRVKVKGQSVNELYKPIGAQVGGQIEQWWPAADGNLKGSPVRMVTAPLMFKGKKMYRFKEWSWVGKIHAVKASFKNLSTAESIIMLKAYGCQDDPDKPVEPVVYAIYEEIEVDCFGLSIGYSVNWENIDYDYKIPVFPSKGDCPGDDQKYMVGTEVTVGPVPDSLTIDDLKYQFVGWIVGEETYAGLSRVKVTMDSEKRVLANYQPASNRYQLKFYAILGSKRTRLETKIYPQPDRDTLYPAGQKVAVGPVPEKLDDGRYVFSGWSLDGEMQPTSEENSYYFEVVMDGNHRLAAVYELAWK